MTRGRTWMCWRCGYTVNAATHLGKEAKPPKDGDLSMCLNCGALYTMHAGAFKPATSMELASLDDATRSKIDRTLKVRSLVVTHDLSKRGGHT